MHGANRQSQLVKDSNFYIAPPGGVHSIITTDIVSHQRQRKLLAHGFSEKVLREQEPLFKVYIDLLIQRLREKCQDGSTQVDMVSWYNWTTFDLSGDLMFGEPFNCLANSKCHPWIDILFDSIKAAIIFSTASLFPGAPSVIMALAQKGFWRLGITIMILWCRKLRRGWRERLRGRISWRIL